ncbi:HMG-Y-related protein A [Linum grandiflorum]
MDPHLPLHNSIPPWAQPPPPPPSSSTPAAVPAVQYSNPYPDLPHPPHYALNFHPAPPPVQTAPSPFPAPAPAAAAAAPQPLPPTGFQPGPTVSYAEMIHSAIVALNERDGSSKRAIAKYIERAYPGLPESHSELLTQNLKRLKASGMLVMVKKSYMLPGSGLPATIHDLPDTSAAAPVNPPPLPPTTELAASGTAATAVAQSGGPKRGRGRPPKPKPILDGLPNGQPESEPAPGSGSEPLQSPEPVTQMMPEDAMPPGFVPNGHQHQPTQQHFTGDINAAENAEPNQNNDAMAVTVPIAVVEEASGVKRRPGRPPKKLLAVDAAGVVIGKRGRGRPPGLGSKKKSPGRPRKPKPKTVADVSGTNGYKKRPGRPPKNQQVNTLVSVPYGLSGEANVSPRPRGRPRKGTGLIAAGVGVGGFSEKRSDDVDVQQPRRSGRPVGRPRKYRDDAGAEAEEQGAFRAKLVFFQTRVRKLYNVLKPMLSDEAPMEVTNAVEQLDVLASLDIDQDIEDQLEEEQPEPTPVEEVHMDMEQPGPVES